MDIIQLHVATRPLDWEPRLLSLKRTFNVYIIVTLNDKMFICKIIHCCVALRFVY